MKTKQLDTNTNISNLSSPLHKKYIYKMLKNIHKNTISLTNY